MNLLDYRNSKYSCIGNDGIIEYIFKTIDVDKGFFVEFGAWDGIVESNCRKLFEEGWKGIFIEADGKKFKDLQKNYDNSGVVCVHGKVGLEDNLFDDIVAPHVTERGIDFCSIDIDGLDVEIFETFKKHLPTVICIEGGQMLHPYHERVSIDVAKHNIQQSLGTMIEIFGAKGYKPICSYQDTFFIKNGFYSKFDVSDNPMVLYLEGLKGHARRLPWIQRTLKNVGIKNDIINELLEACNYSKYGWDKRKIWAVEEKDVIDEYVDKLINSENKITLINELFGGIVRGNRSATLIQILKENPKMMDVIDAYVQEVSDEF